MMQIIIGHDAAVADWMFSTANQRPMLFNMAIGLADDNGALAAGILFTNYNGSDAEVHFLGVGCLSRRVVRLIFGLAIKHFDLNRLTVHTRKKSMARGVSKLGAKFECIVKRLYGATDNSEHSARRYVFYRETMLKLAGIKE